GSGAHRLVAGSNPHVSPDGQTVALLHRGTGRNAQPQLILAPADGSAPPSVLLSGWREPFVFAWAPDSSTIAALRGPEIGKRTLDLTDVVTGKQTVVAKGSSGGFSFDPAGGRLVYARAAGEKFPPRSDVYRFDVPVGQSVRFAPPVRLTHD